jgi:hypothetical protein
MSETAATCLIHKKYWFVKCANPPLAGDPDGYCILHCRNKNKDLAAFRSALRDRWDREDQKDYDFRFVFFPGPFEPYDFFESRKFQKPVDFSFVNFTERADFTQATFIEKAVFYGATFAEEASFYQATFMDRAAFFGAKITGQVIFKAINSLAKGEPSPPAFRGNFQNLQISSNAVLRFQNLSLAQAIFKGTELRRIEFIYVKWHPYRGRQAIHDEVSLRQHEKNEPWFWDWFWIWLSTHFCLKDFAL